MLTLLSEAGRSFLRAFVASAIVFFPGVLNAPDLNQSKALGVAALVGSIAAGLKAIQVFVPKLKFGGKYGVYLDSFSRAFLATFLTATLGLLDAPELSLTRSAVTAVVVAAVTAGVRGVQGLFTPGESPSPGTGFDVK